MQEFVQVNAEPIVELYRPFQIYHMSRLELFKLSFLPILGHVIHRRDCAALIVLSYCYIRAEFDLIDAGLQANSSNPPT